MIHLNLPPQVEERPVVPEGHYDVQSPSMSNTAFCPNVMVYLITGDFFEQCIKMTSPLQNTVDVFEKVDVKMSFVFILYATALKFQSDSLCGA